jgi:RNA polymerase sigma-70 factor (ECF subfamily)
MSSPDISEIMKAYESRLISYAHGILCDYAAAQDIVQETFIKYLRNSQGGGGKKIKNTGAWLYKITRNSCFDILKSARKKTETSLDDGNFSFSIADCNPGSRPDISARRNDDIAVLKNAIEGLPHREREIILLKLEHEKSYSEIAEITGLSAGNVGFILHNVVKELANAVKGREEKKNEL